MTDTLAIPQIKRLAWEESGHNLYTINVAKTNIGWDHSREETPYMAYKLLVEVKRLKATNLAAVQQSHTEALEAAYIPPPEVQHDYKARYKAAHKLNFFQQYPVAYNDGHYPEPALPKINTSNGLTTFIVNMILFAGFRATRINVSGRLIETAQRQASGVILGTKKYMKSMTRRGTADISSTICGRSIMWEVKIGRDFPSPQQLREQERERKAGGEYFFIKTVHEFLTTFDGLMNG